MGPTVLGPLSFRTIESAGRMNLGKKSAGILPLIVSMLLTASACFAGADEENYGSALVDSVTSIYDGDTFRGNIRGYPPIIGHHVSIRIAGIDTPELTDKRPKIKDRAREAKQYTVARLRGAREIRLDNMRRDKYFRILADIIVDNSSLGEELVAKGLAKRYDGSTKSTW